MRKRWRWAFISLLACGGDSAASTVELLDDTYAVTVESHASREAANHYHLSLITDSIDPDPKLSDDEVYVRFEGDLLALMPRSFEISGLTQVETPEGLLALDLSSQVTCDPDANAQGADHWLGDPALYSACLSVVQPYSPARKLTQRLSGTLHIESLEEKHLSGRLELWATGVTAEDTTEEDLVSDPLFYNGVHVELRFHAAL